MGEKTPEELTDGEIFYDLDRFPKVNMVQERSQRGSKNGYLTMVKILLSIFRLKLWTKVSFLYKNLILPMKDWLNLSFSKILSFQ